MFRHTMAKNLAYNKKNKKKTIPIFKGCGQGGTRPAWNLFTHNFVLSSDNAR